MTPNSNLFYFSASAVRTLGGAQMCKQGWKCYSIGFPFLLSATTPFTIRTIGNKTTAAMSQ